MIANALRLIELHRRWPAVLGSLLLLGACATGAPTRTADIVLPSAYDTVSPGTPDGSLDHWWALYEDPQLTGLVTRALAQGFSVREAQSRLAESRALRAAALSRFGLQGNLQASAEYQDTRNIDGAAAPGGAASLTALTTGPTRTASVSLPVSWELDFFGRREATRLAAEADIAAARFDLEAARAAIAAEVTRTLFQTRGLKVQRNEALETLRIQEALLKVVTERARRGLAASSEVDRVAADLALAEAQAEDLSAALASSRRALLVVVGDGTTAVGTDDVLAKLDETPSIPAAVPGDLLARRPDVRRARTRISSAVGDVRLAELDFFPRFTLNPGLGLSAQRGALDTTTSFWSIAAGLTVPVLDRPRLHAQLEAAGARAEQSVLAYERTVQTAFAEADQSLTRLQADRRRIDILARGDGRARTSYEAALKRYDLGFANLQELLDAERAWRATRAALTGAKIDSLQRSVQVFQALGGGWNFTAQDLRQEG